MDPRVKPAGDGCGWAGSGSDRPALELEAPGMFELRVDKVNDPRFMAMVFAAVAAVATVLTLAMPLISGDSLDKRLRAVALERDKIRQRERERISRGPEKIALRQSPKQYMKT